MGKKRTWKDIYEKLGGETKIEIKWTRDGWAFATHRETHAWTKSNKGANSDETMKNALLLLEQKLNAQRNRENASLGGKNKW